jgi:glucose uptake protein GlcU
MTETTTQSKNLWQRMSGPLKVGLTLAALGIALTIIGIFRDPTTPVTAWSLIVGSLISGITWGLVSWAIATAAIEVENDVAEAQITQNPETEPDDSN